MSGLEEIRQRAEAATPGPWTYTGGVEKTAWIEGPVEDVLVHDSRGWGHLSEDYAWIRPADGEFIANARHDIPKLVAVIASILRESEQQPVAHERIYQIITEALG